MAGCWPRRNRVFVKSVVGLEPKTGNGEKVADILGDAALVDTFALHERTAFSRSDLAQTFAAHDQVAVVVADVTEFTSLRAVVDDVDVLAHLNKLFTTFDMLAEKWSATKLDTLGDRYVCAVGLTHPEQQRTVANRALALALEMDAMARRIATPVTDTTRLTIGMHVGPAASGFVGMTRPRHRVFGDAVDHALRTCEHGCSGVLNASLTFAHAVTRKIRWTADVRGTSVMSYTAADVDDALAIVYELKRILL